MMNYQKNHLNITKFQKVKRKSRFSMQNTEEMRLSEECSSVSNSPFR